MASSNTKYADSVKALIQPGTVRHILFMIGMAIFFVRLFINKSADGGGK